MSSPFDTLRMVERLESVGVPREQATMQASLLAEVMCAEESRNAERFASKPEVSTEFVSITAALEKTETRLEAKIETTAADLKSELIRWVLTVVASVGILQTALIAGLLLKFLH